MPYLSWNEQTITDFSDKHISEMYGHGYVFTRIARGVMHQTRSVRIDLSKFELTSENRRILKKTDELRLIDRPTPLPDYDWSLGKLAKDFYETKFGAGTMSAAKVKEMLTDATASNFNTLLQYTNASDKAVGYAICHSNKYMLHYSYPFYDLDAAPKDAGLGMMIRAIVFARESGMKHIYLGSLQRPSDTYKLQFHGLEWFDGTAWSHDLQKVREILATTK